MVVQYASMKRKLDQMLPPPVRDAAICVLLRTEWTRRPVTKFLHLHFRIMVMSLISSWQACSIQFTLKAARLCSINLIKIIFILFIIMNSLAEGVGPSNLFGIICDEESNSIGFYLHPARVDLNFCFYCAFWTFTYIQNKLE